MPWFLVYSAFVKRILLNATCLIQKDEPLGFTIRMRVRLVCVDTLHIVSSRTGVGHRLTLAALGIKRTFGSVCILGNCLLAYSSHCWFFLL